MRTTLPPTKSRITQYPLKDPERCPHCNSCRLIRKGTRKKKLESVPLWRCKSCGRTFTQPGQELLTGSIQKSPAVRKPPSDDPVASFVAPSSFQPTLRRVQIGVVVRTPVPLPRPRPKRI